MNTRLLMKIIFIFTSLFLIILIATSWYHYTEISLTLNSPTFTVSQLNSLEYLPIIYQPQKDPDKLVAVYYYKFPNRNTTEITLVFSGEDHPYWFVNKIYTLFRILKYHRTEDIETFYMETNKEGKIREINFSYKGIGTYSGKQIYDTHNPKHYMKQSSELEWSENRPHIYVNTWNHLFAERNSNTELSYIEWKNYPLFTGTREKAESDFKLNFMSIFSMLYWEALSA